MIVVTGAAGFIGSCLLTELSRLGFAELVAVDDFSNSQKELNLRSVKDYTKIDRNNFEAWMKENHARIQFVFHIGARTNTAEFDMDLLNRLNLDYSKMLWQNCVNFSIPMVYASSAATYGLGEMGFDDKVAPKELHPLNPFGVSKNEFDKWVLTQQETPPFWAGFKFFNVFGPNEYHKGRMASVVFHAYNQIKENGKMKLFQSHHPDYKDGEQQRDFVYVKDVLKVLLYMMENRKHSGIYNLGSGRAETFLALVQGVFAALGKEPQIEFVPTPEDIRDKYQYYTCANLNSLRKAGYTEAFTDFREAVMEYTSTYLNQGKYY